MRSNSNGSRIKPLGVLKQFINGYTPEFGELERLVRKHSAGDMALQQKKSLDFLAEESQDILARIWGTADDSWLVPAITLAYNSIFLIPEIIDSTHRINPYRYSEENISQDVKTTAIKMETSVGLYRDYERNAVNGLIQNPKTGLYHWKYYSGEFNPKLTSNVIRSFHVPRIDYIGSFLNALNAKVATFLGNGPRRGIPHIAMAYFMSEAVRASEFLAQKNGVNLTDEDHKVNFRYFSAIMQQADYHFPDLREHMNILARQIDDRLVGENPKVSELVHRLYRLNIIENHGLTPSTIEEFLLPNSKSVFRQIADEEDFSKYHRAA